MPRYFAEELYSRVALLRNKLGNGFTILDSSGLVPITTTKDFECINGYLIVEKPVRDSVQEKSVRDSVQVRL